jgi:hypothetical protein
MRTALQWLFRALAVGFFCSAIFHAAAYFNGSLEPRMSPLEHAVFVPINLAFAVGTLYRPRWFIVAFAVLCAQQIYSHGTLGIIAWRHGVFDWRSLMVVLSLPPALLLLIYEARLRAAPARA